MSETLVKVEGVSKKFCRSLKRSLWYGMQDLGRELVGRPHGGDGNLRKEEFWAVKDVSFELKRGECLGLIGHNGAGKTTLLRMLNGLIKPDQGRIEMHGRVGALIALGAGFNPILTGRENIYVNGAVLGLSKREIDQKLDEIIDFAGIEEFIDSPVQSYSSGMSVRLGFSIATAVKPDILILDEILAVGDVGFKMKAYSRIGEIIQDCAVLFVTHSMHQVYRVCDSVGVMRKGTLSVFSDSHEGVSEYKRMAIVGGCQALVVSGASISRFDYRNSNAVSSEGEWFLDIALFGDGVLCVGQVVVNFTSSEGILVAEFRDMTKRQYLFKDGQIVVRVEVERIFLAAGKYSFDFAIYGEGGKSTVAHVSGAGPVDILSSVGTEAVSLLSGSVSEVEAVEKKNCFLSR